MLRRVRIRPLPILQPGPARLALGRPAAGWGHAVASPDDMRPTEGRPYLTRMATEGIATVAAEAYEVIGEEDERP